MSKNQFGVPYMGSKSKIAKEIIEQLPSSDNIYDLFGGGGAISHCAYLSCKYKNVHYNELNTLVYDGFKKAINCEYDNDYRWISREDFNKFKDADFYVACCFSFGNNFKTYMYSPDKEKYKKAYHYLVCFDDWTYMNELFTEDEIKIFQDKLNGIEGVKNRRTKMAHIIADFIKENTNTEAKGTINTDNGNGRNLIQNLERIQEVSKTITFENDKRGNGRNLNENLQCLDRLQEVGKTITFENDKRGNGSNLNENLQCLDRLQEVGKTICTCGFGPSDLNQNLQRLERIQDIKQSKIEGLYFTNKDYREIQIESNSIIYCDIPYKNTGTYKFEFDYEVFYNWCEEQTVPVYISEYNMPEDRFKCIWEKPVKGVFSQTVRNDVVEKLFVPIKQIKAGIIK